MKSKTVKRRAGRRFAGAHGLASWFDVTDRLPNSGDRVMAIYKGVYDHRLVTFWLDEGGNPHFGWPSEPDGKGSQPATHWHHLPKMPNDQAQARRTGGVGGAQGKETK